MSSPQDNPHKGRTGLDRIIHAAGYSWAGLKAAYSGESAFRQETWLCILAAPLAFWLAKTWEQAALLLGSLLVVIIVELLNSAIEAVVDRVSFERHELSKRAKDIASAAVLMALLLAAGVWGAAIWQHLR
ncbi:diacylglycerol kinase [Roseateles saccharophilus]|uniref:Diacylglycerol kinase n=1 Tax=Roseateles saccharophilus TaxID=304 RepID=A0A4R3V4T1_ROSSA|nr:diacylglycerol kinase [Roseateles saccharophilus]MDG0831534.1 diacylglycerol kinase [Roseateles saccharophilus]TCU98582.1 diacylglycerol kinase (ATP) [Roseateles saccharophilus]